MKETNLDNRKPSSAENVVFICKDCAQKLYPKGRKKADMQFAEYVKKLLGREHIWVRITRVDDNGVAGTVDNMTVFEETPKFGTEVFVKYEEIEDVM
jgi:hypothetical protein